VTITEAFTAWVAFLNEGNASFCARVDLFLSMFISASVGASSKRGAILEPRLPRPGPARPMAPIAFGSLANSTPRRHSAFAPIRLPRRPVVHWR
jgi:hypothetical protein